MISIYKYETEEEAKELIEKQKNVGLEVFQISNITEGNFIAFFNPRVQIDTKTAQLEKKVDALQAAVDALTLGGMF